MYISAAIDQPGILIGEYRTAEDRGRLRIVLGLMASAQYYVEVTPDGVTFVDQYLEVTERVQIVPHEHEEFGTDDVVDIIGLSPQHFGEARELGRKIRGQLRFGHVFAYTAGDDYEWLGTSLTEISQDGLAQ